MLPDGSHQASHCFAFEQDFVGGWRCIPLCLRRKLDLAGIKLKLGHWIELDQEQRQVLVDWPDDPASLAAMADHIRQLTAPMADGMAKNLAPARGESWQSGTHLPADLASSSEALGQPLSPGTVGPLRRTGEIRPGQVGTPWPRPSQSPSCLVGGTQLSSQPNPLQPGDPFRALRLLLNRADHRYRRRHADRGGLEFRLA